MRFETLFFDLDGTLYPEDNGLWDAIKARIDRYLLEVMGFTPQEARRLRKVFMQQYGTTLRGLQTEFHIDAEHYLAYVHDLPLDQYLAPNPALRGLLLGLSARRWIFTNSDAGHAGRVLDALGLAGCFEGIIDIRALEFICKPDLPDVGRRPGEPAACPPDGFRHGAGQP
jgi:putative hydrolase of the HAD superfamily